jgi:hypothetical protein
MIVACYPADHSDLHSALHLLLPVAAAWGRCSLGQRRGPRPSMPLIAPAMLCICCCLLLLPPGAPEDNGADPDLVHRFP